MLVILLSAVPLAAGYVSTLGDSARDDVVRPQVTEERPQNVTVIATDSNSWLGREGEGPRALSELVAVDGKGEVVYYNNSHTRYWDVDPVENTSMTVEYVTADHLSPSQCGGKEACTRNSVERVNLSTGEVTRVFSRVTPGKHSTRWHDVDRIDKNHIVVADIYGDRVFVVNTTSGLETWSWDAQNDFNVASTGGPFPEDWTHINDVEVLPDGRFMVSIRNHDQVVFLDRTTGLQENWTLGADNKHDVLYEQHNPDYIPRANGGPAVLVADSENNRIVEYQRSDGDWKRSWTWRDSRLQWARDGDRLPNGNTLITDSNGNRVLEVNRQGKVVWSVEVAFPYEAERLGTGDESAGGPSAASANLSSGSGGTGPADSSDQQSGTLPAIESAIDSVLRGPRVNAVMYVLPAWMGKTHLLALVMLALAALTWAGAELYWSPWTVRLHNPVEFDRRP